MQQPPDADHQVDLPLGLACVDATRRVDHEEIRTELRGRQLGLPKEPDEIHDELGM